MSRLLWIRHGQASWPASPADFDSETYDRLSSLGAEQGAALGRHWARTGTTVDAIYCGPRNRHRDTMLAIVSAAGAAGLPLPEPIFEERLDEYPAFELFRMHLPELSKLTDAAALRAGIEAITKSWIEGTLEAGQLESYQSFHQRTSEVLARIADEQGRGKTVAVVTSGGPVSLAVKMALELSPIKASRLAWVIANASVTELRYRDDELALFAFNHIAHLDEPRLVTFR